MNHIESYRETAAVIDLDAESRGTFVSRTYTHLFSAIAAFTLIEVILFRTGLAATINNALLSVSWLFVLGGFILVAWLASRAAHMATSKAAQYAALGGFVLAEAIIFIPLLYAADRTAPGAIASAAVVTFFAFAALTVIVFMTRKDFSFLRTAIIWGGIVALALIAAGVVFGFHLGTVFSVAMVALAGAAILYDTSNVLHHYPQDRYVAAALQLFASVALMMWYVLRIFMSRR
jgi:uncharacterized protein